MDMDTACSAGMHFGKRKYVQEEFFGICVTAAAKCGNKNTTICKYRIFEYSVDCSWDDVYHDVSRMIRTFVPTKLMWLRCIYLTNLMELQLFPMTKLTGRDQRALTHTLEKYGYTCGSVLTPDGDVLQEKVFVKLQLSCQSHIEFPYYASYIGRPDVCAHCGAVEADKSQEMMQKFRIVLPVYQQCLEAEKDIPKIYPIKRLSTIEPCKNLTSILERLMSDI